jgi:hypothetical protein
MPGLTAGHRPNDHIGLGSSGYRLRQRRINRFVGEIHLAGEKPHEIPALLASTVADSPLQHRVSGFERIEHRALRHFAIDLECHLSPHPSEPLQVKGQQHANHGSVWTSTDNTAGKSRTIGAQVSPASGEA